MAGMGGREKIGRVDVEETVTMMYCMRKEYCQSKESKN